MQPEPTRDAIQDQPHVLVVDDDRRLRDLLRRYLAEHGYIVTSAKDAADARARLTGLAFDAIILDVMMPGEDGFTLTETLRRTSAVPILLLTAMDEVEHRITGLERGADDYLAKPFEPRELLLRLRNILRRTGDIEREDEGTVRFGVFEFDSASGALRRDGADVALTSGEAELLRALSDNAGTPVSREALSQAHHVATRAVDVQITRLRRKIEDNPRDPRFLVTVRGAGYMLRKG
jgi:two-component system phosphate regulon response regulator OmpR